MKRIITLIIAMTAVTTAFCREIRGLVVGENGTPLDYVNVVLYHDSIYVTGTVTDTAGAFFIEHLHPRHNDSVKITEVVET
ncbi:hypothetical protein [Muribaculum gordoncarteri]|uniref:hypothetical protein n=1 Tax=Muribaculum gordoncarteri TaxID=2530390 RepID=UPI003F66CC50